MVIVAPETDSSIVTPDKRIVLPMGVPAFTGTSLRRPAIYYSAYDLWKTGTTVALSAWDILVDAVIKGDINSGYLSALSYLVDYQLDSLSDLEAIVADPYTRPDIILMDNDLTLVDYRTTGREPKHEKTVAKIADITEVVSFTPYAGMFRIAGAYPELGVSKLLRFPDGHDSKHLVRFFNEHLIALRYHPEYLEGTRLVDDTENIFHPGGKNKQHIRDVYEKPDPSVIEAIIEFYRQYKGLSRDKRPKILVVGDLYATDGMFAQSAADRYGMEVEMQFAQVNPFRFESKGVWKKNILLSPLRRFDIGLGHQLSRRAARQRDLYEQVTGEKYERHTKVERGLLIGSSALAKSQSADDYR
ncbi:MAG: hypothetical protein ABIE94_01990 [archaeon]